MSPSSLNKFRIIKKTFFGPARNMTDHGQLGEPPMGDAACNNFARHSYHHFPAAPRGRERRKFVHPLLYFSPPAISPPSRQLPPSHPPTHDFTLNVLPPPFFPLSFLPSFLPSPAFPRSLLRQWLYGPFVLRTTKEGGEMSSSCGSAFPLLPSRWRCPTLQFFVRIPAQIITKG